ncbi:isopentenyl-diphosphate Delta-isomerase [Pseudoflavitalea sp. X16]|uniref:isopentenyl-diphosphate Delta-isomerase n=1 Tax=Paraflavitalea devenefica TaxID=2716334 RepID=UPI0014231AF9|nr:isopentenyl-diphosphate Delta-isomerase [Paraflavitalea devenefica]NII23999.1 isopentenyl-diphosphate Delta-isomerase [Paraflavitalea devenefica]
MEIVNQVILVNEQDEQIGTMEKIEAHRKAVLHRAFSVFIFNSKGEMLLQQRAFSKYHSGGLWTNACCGHPTPGEATADAARRRLGEEMGFMTDLHELFDFTYRHAFDNGLTEYEYDHVFVGSWDNDVLPASEEVNDYCYISLEEIAESMASNPQQYTVWFRIIYPRIEAWARKTA